ncbi:radical SAM protein [Phorcysia thermohydrogeniphila]|uniref:Wyosine [tRNA(Phe)-imidazoG37] synthetase (Radical SAM superfamily) n=1 Tax=Phorcysia thermohydrogeniphila TaxID=936138 RepID=A0A4R1GHX1_9BACT|nr:radical SAM protein [Phorcysia thermohydrogeniphila]TCK06395.1 wyosine [tRNA(Phe)-imidazoG37] synthetase (radical SAM superfamily) [Phorcysia thermohydrogeniphila]
MKYVFGPVFSRRLGFSLGVDLVPYKVCSMDCLYCEVGKTSEKTTSRLEYVPLDSVKSELGEFLKASPDIDFITFSGYGEPTLYSKLGELVDFLKENYSYRLALLTNSSLLYRDDVLEEVKKIDVVLPSLDAATQSTFEKINRPVEGLKLEQLVEGIERLIKETPCEVWVETLFVKGVNDSPEEVEKIGEIIHQLKPHKWQLNTVVRPPAYSVKGLSLLELEKIKERVGYPSTEIVAGFKREKRKMGALELKNEVYGIVVRRPCPIDEIASALGVSEEEVERAVSLLIEEGKVREIFFGGTPYVKGIV